MTVSLSLGERAGVRASQAHFLLPGGACDVARDNATDDNVDVWNFYDTSQKYVGVKSVCSNSVASPAICTVKLNLKRSTGIAPSGTLKVGIYSHSSTVPGSLIGGWSDTINASTLTASHATYTLANISMGAGLTATTTYWVVCGWSGSSTTDYPQWSQVRYTGNDAISEDGTSWTAYDTATEYFELFSQ
jgi:hypothetical protein